MHRQPAMLSGQEAQAALGAALREVHAGARLEDWSELPLSKRGKRRTVRYDLTARLTGLPYDYHYQCVGKFYDADDEARRVAAILRTLATTDNRARGGLVIPSVLGYYAPRHVLLLTYESGESVISAIARDKGVVLEAIGHALAALHATPARLDWVTSSATVLADLQQRVTDLRARFPAQAASLEHALDRLERQAPPAPVTPSFLHGNLGPTHLLWQQGRIVLLDFDRSTRGDPALDLGSLLTQMHRLTVRKPGKLSDFASLRAEILDAYQRAAPHDPGLARRVAWYEQATLLRKIHFLAAETTPHSEAGVVRRRRIEAMRLLGSLH